jgi:chromosome segregation ATPase
MTQPLNLNAAPFIPSWMNPDAAPFVPSERIKALEKENAELKKTIQELQLKTIRTDALQKENNNLKKQMRKFEEMEEEIVAFKDKIHCLNVEIGFLKAERDTAKDDNERLQKENKNLKKHYSEHVSELMKEDEKNERLEQIIQKQSTTICELKAHKDQAIANMDAMRTQVEEKGRGITDLMEILRKATEEYTQERGRWAQEKVALQSTLETLCMSYQSKNAETNFFRTIAEGCERRIKEVQEYKGIYSELFIPNSE